MPQPTQRTCPQGHKYMKSSDCPVCPICESAKDPGNDFMAAVGAPARRALQGAGITNLNTLAKWTKADLLKLHGFGPSSIPRLERVLNEHGLRFKE